MTPTHDFSAGANTPPASRARKCCSMDTDEFRLAIRALGGPTGAARMIGCSHTLVSAWLTAKRPISGTHALRLRELLMSLTNGTLQRVCYALKIEAQQAEQRAMRRRAQRPLFPAARGDKPRLTPAERAARSLRRQEIKLRLKAGETVAALAGEFGVSERVIERWAGRHMRSAGILEGLRDALRDDAPP